MSLSEVFGDPRVELYAALNYAGTDYSKGLYVGQSVVGSPLWELMRAGNYNNRRPDQGENDIHQDFVDFLRRAGSLVSSGTGPTSSGMAPPASGPAAPPLARAPAPLGSSGRGESLLDIPSPPGGQTALIGGAGINELLANFGASIPDAPIGTRMWYTDSGALRSVTINDSTQLRKIYEEGTRSTSIPTANDYNLNLQVFLQNLRKAHDKDCPEAKPQPPLEYCKDGEGLPTFEDMAYGMTWHWDDAKKTYYRYDENGKVQLYSDMQYNQANCYGSALKNGQCNRLIECIADGNPSSLSACMDIIEQVDLWDVASDDVKSVNPDVVKLVLRKFGVQGVKRTDNSGRAYVEPMSVEQWRNELATAGGEANLAILGNEKLERYIAALINICKANPAIINKREVAVSSTGVYTSSPKSNYVQQLGRSQYIDPREVADAQAVTAEQLRALRTNYLYATPRFSPVMGLQNSWITPGLAQYQMLGGASGATGQTGGLYTSFGIGQPHLLTRGTRLEGKNLSLSDGSSNIFEGLFNSIKKGLSDMGLQMDGNEEKRVVGAINKLKEIEGKLLQLAKRLNLAIRLGEGLGTNAYNLNRAEATTISWDNVRTLDDARAFMVAQTNKLRENYDSIYGFYGQLSGDLMTQIYPRLLDRCCKPCPETKAAEAKTEFFPLTENC